MLKQRILTALILFTLITIGILTLPTIYIALFMGLIIAVGAWEWSKLTELPNIVWRICYVMTILLLLGGAWFFVHQYKSSFFSIVFFSVCCWLIALVLVMQYPKYNQCYSSKLNKALIGIVVLVPTWVAIVGLHSSDSYGPYLVIYLILLTSVADTSAYFGGKRWGVTKLAPVLSPGKSWEGVFSAIITTALFSALSTFFLGIASQGIIEILEFIILSLVVVIMSIVGDLTESLFKRLANLKDSGSILPGHGGILDRIDSMTAAAPSFVVGLWLILDFKFNFNASIISGVSQH